jgi:hypothetical protein
VQAGGPGAADRQEQRFARDVANADRRRAAVEVRRHGDDQPARRREGDACLAVADGDGWQVVDREAGAAQGDATAFDGAEWRERGNQGQVSSSSTFQYR